MKKTYAAPLLLLSLGLLPWGATQTRTALFDLKKSQQELEIMRGILGTTLGFVMKDSSAPEPKDDFFHTSWRFSNVSAFYLYGQGAIFIIPASSFRNVYGQFGKEGRLWEPHEQELEAAVLAAESQVRVLEGLPGGFGVGGVIGGVPGGVVGGVTGGVEGGIPGGVRAGTRVQAPVPPPAPSPATPAPAPQPPQPRQDKIREKLLKAQEDVKKRREEAEAKRAKFLEQLAEIKVYLVEALANHGDSLTHVKPNEYLTILITTDEGDLVFKGGTRSHREVLSVQKSAVMDYKAGKLTLDAFKQKVLNYTN